MEQYKACGGRITSPDESPEPDGDRVGDGNMFTISIYPLIEGHAVSVNGVLCVCEAAYGDVLQRDMMAPLNSFKWLVADDQGLAPLPVENLSSNLMLRASRLYYKDSPLTAYNQQAV